MGQYFEQIADINLRIFMEIPESLGMQGNYGMQ